MNQTNNQYHSYVSQNYPQDPQNVLKNQFTDKSPSDSHYPQPPFPQPENIHQFAPFPVMYVMQPSIYFQPMLPYPPPLIPGKDPNNFQAPGLFPPQNVSFLQYQKNPKKYKNTKKKPPLNQKKKKPLAEKANKQNPKEEQEPNIEKKIKQEEQHHNQTQESEQEEQKTQENPQNSSTNDNINPKILNLFKELEKQQLLQEKPNPPKPKPQSFKQEDLQPQLEPQPKQQPKKSQTKDPQIQIKEEHLENHINININNNQLNISQNLQLSSQLSQQTIPLSHMQQSITQFTMGQSTTLGINPQQNPIQQDEKKDENQNENQQEKEQENENDTQNIVEKKRKPRRLLSHINKKPKTVQQVVYLTRLYLHLDDKCMFPYTQTQIKEILSYNNIFSPDQIDSHLQNIANFNLKKQSSSLNLNNRKNVTRQDKTDIMQFPAKTCLDYITVLKKAYYYKFFIHPGSEGKNVSDLRKYVIEQEQKKLQDPIKLHQLNIVDILNQINV